MVDGAGPEYKRRNSITDSDSLLKDKSGPINAHIIISDVGKDGRICEISIWQSTSNGSSRDFEKAVKILLKGLFIAKATIHFVGRSLDRQLVRIESPASIAFDFPMMHPNYPPTKALLILIRQFEAKQDPAEKLPQRYMQIRFTLPRTVSLDHFLGEVLNPTGEYRVD